MKTTLAYIRIQFPGQPIEDSFIHGLPNFEVRSIGWHSKEDKTYDVSKIPFTQVEMKKLLPDFIAGFFVRKPYSGVSFAVLRGLERYLADANIVYAAEPYSFLSAQCAKYCSKSDKKLVISCFETIPNSPQLRFPPYSFNVRYVKDKADMFVAYTNKAADCLRAISIPDEKIKVVYPGVDLDFFSPNKISHDSIRVLFVGRFDREKGLSVLLNAFKKLCLEIKNLELWVVGPIRSGEDYESAKAMAKKYPVKIIGPVNRAELRRFYNQCDIFCAPSMDKKKFGIKVWEEQFGAVFVEAMACGLPIVSTKCGAIPEIISEDNIIVSQGSEVELYNGIKKLIMDDSLRKFISEENRNRAERLFDIKRQRQKLEEILLNL